ncbi:MAG: hypothetical protein B6I28_04580, partial [Fusobacteriia bacterium 4572_132]
MNSKIVMVFIILIQFNIYAYKMIGEAYGNDKSDFIQPIAIQKINKDFYILDYILGKIIIFDNDFNIKKEILGFENPIAFKVIKKNIFVSEANSNKIIIYNLETEKKKTLGLYGMMEKEFSHPGKIYMNNNKLYIVDEYNFRIQVLDEKLNFIKEILLPKFEYIYTPYYLTNYSLIFKTEEMYVLDNYSKKMYIYGEKKKRKEINLSFISNLTSFFEFQEEIYVYDAMVNKLYRLDKEKFTKKEEIILEKEKKYDVFLMNQITKDNQKLYFINKNIIKKIDLKSKKNEDIFKLKKLKAKSYIDPTSIIVDEDEKIYILDKTLGVIKIFDKKGKYIKQINNIGKTPTDMILDKNNNLYIAVAGENRVRKYNKKNELIYNFGGYKYFPTSYNFYNQKLKEKKQRDINKIDQKVYNLQLDIDGRGNLYIMNSKSVNIKKFDQFFVQKNTIGKKANILYFLQGKKELGTFGWNEQESDVLTDICINKD